MTLDEVFWPKVKKSSGCWEWAGTIAGGGYGYFYDPIKKKSLRAHRVSYELAVGKIPDGLFVCHQCDNKPCVRPDHLYLGDNQTNIRHAFERGLMHNPTKDVCPKGHKKEGANAFTYKSSHHGNVYKGCRECRKIADRKYKARKRKAKLASILKGVEKA